MKRLAVAVLLLAACGGESDSGRELIHAYGCGSCHVIPGVRGATGQIGPSLEGLSARMYLAGQLPNTRENLTRWIRAPQSIEGGTAMPNMNVSEKDARAMVAYLSTLGDGSPHFDLRPSEAHAHPRPSQRPPMPVLHPQDRDFLERASQGSNAEIATGGLAANRAVGAEVRGLGARMVNDHASINRGLATIAGKHRIILPTGLGDQQASYDRLVDLHREHFDREFVQVMIEDHQMAVLLFQGEAADGVDPEIRAFAARTLPLIQAHLQHAKSLRAPVPSVAPHTGETAATRSLWSAEAAPPLSYSHKYESGGAASALHTTTRRTRVILSEAKDLPAWPGGGDPSLRSG